MHDIAGIPIVLSHHVPVGEVYALNTFSRPDGGSLLSGWHDEPSMLRARRVFVAHVLTFPYLKWLIHWRAAWWLDA